LRWFFWSHPFVILSYSLESHLLFIPLLERLSGRELAGLPTSMERALF
jgi:hypothetical protein